MKLFVQKTVKCEVINFEFLSRDLPLNNSAIMVKWKCLKSLYSWKGMCRIDRQLKKTYTFEIFNSWNTLYFFLYIQLVFYSFTQTYFLSPMFSGINNNNFSFFGFSNLSFFVFVFTTLKKKRFLNIFSITLMLFQIRAL